ncbi:unnamed protein product [Discula destructiva]
MARALGACPLPDTLTNPQPIMHNGVLASAAIPGSLKRKASDSNETLEHGNHACAKRSRQDYRVATPPDTPPAPSYTEYLAPSSPSPTVQDSCIDDRIADIANEHLGREILLRHQELRFINQELAKCQTALEQLRRCHLIPYPTTCPTPNQMLDIMDGKGPAVQCGPGAESTPQWAPPYGVVDGPYARHYAKWLIPDPKFDGQMPEWIPVSEASKNAEGRSTRNSVSASAPEGATIGQRVARGQTSQTQPPPSQPEKKVKKGPTGPAFMKRHDGVMVKLICCVCQRWDFCNVQGFINHVRISHQLPLLSHREAAIRCGVPSDPSEVPVPVVAEKKVNTVPSVVAPSSHVPTGTVLPLAATERHALAKLEQNAAASLTGFPGGRIPGVARTLSDDPKSTSAGVASRPSKSFVGSSATPSLSMLMQQRGYEVDLSSHVEDARTKVVDPLDDDEDDEDDDEQPEVGRGQVGQMAAMRPTAAPASEQRPVSSRGRSVHLSLDPGASRLYSVTSSMDDEDASSDFDSNLMDNDHSPITATSNNEPPLVSDDGGDESDDAASSSDASDADAMQEDVAEVDPEYHDDYLAHHAAGTSSGTQKKDVSA